MIRTAIIGGMAVSLFAAVAPSAQAQSLGSIFNCGASGNTQAGSAAIGGVLGGLAGAGVAKNDALGAILGAAVGAAAGSWIGCRLHSDDQVSLEQATTRALNDDRSTTWSNPRTGASARINVMADTNNGYNGYNGYSGYGGADSSYIQYGRPLAYNQVRLDSRIRGVNAFETVAPSYTAVSQTYIRTAPSLRAQTNGSLARGERFEAMAKVSGQPWILVGRNGYGVGYVPEDVVRAVAESVTASGYGYARPIPRQAIRLGTGVNWATSYESTSSLYRVRSNANLRATPSLQGRTLGQVYRGDEIEAIARVQGSPWVLVGRNGYGIGYVNEGALEAQSIGGDYAYDSGYQTTASACRIVEQVITSRDYGTQTQRYRACRSPGGQWNLAAT